jgi:hypothetical protein
MGNKIKSNCYGNVKMALAPLKEQPSRLARCIGMSLELIGRQQMSIKFLLKPELLIFLTDDNLYLDLTGNFFVYLNMIHSSCIAYLHM